MTVFSGIYPELAVEPNLYISAVIIGAVSTIYIYVCIGFGLNESGLPFFFPSFFLDFSSFEFEPLQVHTRRVGHLNTERGRERAPISVRVKAPPPFRSPPPSSPSSRVLNRAEEREGDRGRSLEARSNFLGKP